jgi:hypothetical protein
VSRRAALAARPFALVLSLLFIVPGTASSVDSDSTAPLEIFTPVPPSVFEGTDHLFHLAYELHITNFATVNETLDRFEIVGDDGKTLGDFSASKLDSMLVHPGIDHDSTSKSTFTPNGRSIIFVWLTLQSQQKPPKRLSQRFYMSTSDSETGKPESDQIELPPLSVSGVGPIVIAAPLRGSGWIAGNGPSNYSVHRRGSFPYYGRATNAERYAYDFIKIGTDGMAFKGNRDKNDSWLGFGADVLAVAKGAIVAVQDGIPENVPFSSERPVAITPQTSGGNFVCEDIGGGLFALYAHLEPDSIRVKVGDRVDSGHVLGLLGNTGNSTNAHLHFQVSTGIRIGEGEGIPTSFRNTHLVGTADLIRSVGFGVPPATWKSGDADHQGTDEFLVPLQDAILSFE